MLLCLLFFIVYLYILGRSKNGTEHGKGETTPILFDKTQSIIRQLNGLLGGTLVTYYNNPRGSVCYDDVVALYELLVKLGKSDATVLSHSYLWNAPL